jgi:hypothetical protein
MVSDPEEARIRRIHNLQGPSVGIRVWSVGPGVGSSTYLLVVHVDKDRFYVRFQFALK